ncbi:glycosyltransferase family 9 protein [Carnimonas bestiolae]|uniref:glycosyltransferase family 9 protein n=1 Tax=Carnimonas bestiolae TaxID=3402172 RepID=UPI003EDBA6A5
MKSKNTLDRRIGKWLLHHWYDFRPSPLHMAQVSTAVLFIPRLIGDGMATFPALRALQACNVAQIIVIASHSNKTLFEPLAASGAITLHTVPSLRDTASLKALARRLRQQQSGVDLCIDASLKDSTATISFIGTLKARCNIQMSGSPMRCYAPVSQRAVEMYEKGESVPICWAALMHDAGIADVAPRFELPIPQAIAQQVNAYVKPLGRYIAVNLDGSTDDKQLSVEKGVLLAEHLWRYYQLPMIMLCSPQGEEKARALSQRCEHVTVPELPRSLHHSAALVAGSALTVTPDTSLLHVASAHNVPVIGIYRRYNGHWVPLSDSNAMIITNGQVDRLTADDIQGAIHKVRATAPE